MDINVGDTIHPRTVCLDGNLWGGREERQSPKIHKQTNIVERLKLEEANVYWDRKSVFFSDEKGEGIQEKAALM